MYKFVTIYRKVDDEQALERFFSETHLPLAEALPGLRECEVSRVQGKPGGQSRFHLMVELYFDTREDFLWAFASETGNSLISALKPWDDARVVTWFNAEAYFSGPTDPAIPEMSPRTAPLE